MPKHSSPSRRPAKIEVTPEDRALMRQISEIYGTVTMDDKVLPLLAAHTAAAIRAAIEAAANVATCGGFGVRDIEQIIADDIHALSVEQIMSRSKIKS